MRGSGKAARLGAADWLSLAAAPVFALMALLGGVFDGASEMHGSGMHGSDGLIDGMALMYLLMSVFHAAPWLTLIAIRRAAERRADSPASRPSWSGRRCWRSPEDPLDGLVTPLSLQRTKQQAQEAGSPQGTKDAPVELEHRDESACRNSGGHVVQ